MPWGAAAPDVGLFKINLLKWFAGADVEFGYATRDNGINRYIAPANPIRLIILDIDRNRISTQLITVQAIIRLPEFPGKDRYTHRKFAA